MFKCWILSCNMQSQIPFQLISKVIGTLKCFEKLTFDDLCLNNLKDDFDLLPQFCLGNALLSWVKPFLLTRLFYDVCRQFCAQTHLKLEIFHQDNGFEV